MVKNHSDISVSTISNQLQPFEKSKDKLRCVGLILGDFGLFSIHFDSNLSNFWPKVSPNTPKLDTNHGGVSISTIYNHL